MSAGEALTTLVHYILVSRARQVGMSFTIREAAVEVWAWPAKNKKKKAELNMGHL